MAEQRVGKKSIGRIIEGLRREKGISQRKLCYGLCSDTELARIEMDLLIPDFFVLDCLLSRLGKASDKFEYILSREGYRLYELRFWISRAFGDKNLEMVRNLLDRYIGQKQAKKPLHLQYVMWVKVQLAWMEGTSTELVENMLKEALSATMPVNKEKEIWDYKLSTQELQLLVCKWHFVACRGKEEKAIKKLRIALEYAQSNYTDMKELSHIYPRIVNELSLLLFQQGEYNDACILCEKALSLLKKEGILKGVYELLMRQEAALDKINGPDYIKSQVKIQRESMEKIYERFGYANSLDWTGDIWLKEISVDYEILRRNRYAYGMTQDAVCEDICTQENLSRIEKGKVTPTFSTLKHLSDRLGIQREKIDSILSAEDFCILEYKNRITRNIGLLNFNAAEEALDELKERLKGNNPKQQQYIMEKETSIQWWEHKITSEEALKRLWETFRYTTESFPVSEVFSCAMSRTEINILIQIAIILEQNERDMEAIYIYKQILKAYSESVVDIHFHLPAGTIWGNLAILLEKTGQKREALKAAEKHLHIQVECNKMDDLVRSVILIGNIKGEENEHKDAEHWYQIARNIGSLTGESRRIEIWEENLSNKQ